MRSHERLAGGGRQNYFFNGLPAEMPAEPAEAGLPRSPVRPAAATTIRGRNRSSQSLSSSGLGLEPFDCAERQVALSFSLPPFRRVGYLLSASQSIRLAGFAAFRSAMGHRQPVEESGVGECGPPIAEKIGELPVKSEHGCEIKDDYFDGLLASRALPRAPLCGIMRRPCDWPVATKTAVGPICRWSLCARHAAKGDVPIAVKRSFLPRKSEVVSRRARYKAFPGAATNRACFRINKWHGSKKR